MHITYTLWTNTSSGFRRSYAPGDTIVRGHQGVVTADSITEAAELVFRRHNADDRPDGRSAPSMSIGDVVEFADMALSVEPIGFTTVTLNASDKVTDRTWKDVIDSMK